MTLTMKVQALLSFQTQAAATVKLRETEPFAVLFGTDTHTHEHMLAILCHWCW